jgi:hypothetical protein
MRSVFCKAEDPKVAMRALAKQLHNKYGVVATVIEEKNDIECGYYNIHFCKEREWEILSTTRPGSGYLTIPYNRLLLSANGVKPEDCKLNRLIELAVKSCHDSEYLAENAHKSFEAVEKPAVVAAPINPKDLPLNEEQKKTVEDYKKEAEEYAPAFSAVAVGADIAQTPDHSAKVHIPNKVQFNI